MSGYTIVNLKEVDDAASKFGPSPMRNFEAGPDGAEIVVFGAPRTEPGDAELTPGWWTE